jgi:hypothetical protein
MANLGNLPANIPQGWASLYGIGTAIGITGIRPNNSDWVFATIYGLGDCNTPNNIGDSVMFNTKDVICTLAYDSGIFTMIEQAKLGITEQPLA